MKKLLLLTLVCICAVLITGCVPDEKDSLSIGPDFSPNQNPTYEFTQLHNDTLAQFEGLQPYAFITNCDIGGSNEAKSVTVTAVCYDDVDAETASHFAAALLRKINDAAYVQNNTLKKSDSKSFGPLWDTYSFDLKIYTESEAAKENPTAVYTLTLTPGQSSGLDPDIETYEAEWEKEYEILMRNSQ